MNTTLLKKDFWKSDEYIELHLDTKIVYLYLLSCPDKGYLNVFKFNKHPATLCTGVSNNSLEAGLDQLEKGGFIERFNGYVGLLKGDASSVGGPWGNTNRVRELEAIPIDVREHFKLDNEGIVVKKVDKKVVKKPGPAPETIKSIIERQPESLRGALKDFVEDRIERKKAPTTRAVKGWITKLQEMYPDNPVMQAKSLQQSIDRGWMGLFEVKEDTKRESAFL